MFTRELDELKMLEGILNKLIEKEIISYNEAKVIIKNARRMKKMKHKIESLNTEVKNEIYKEKELGLDDVERDPIKIGVCNNQRQGLIDMLEYLKNKNINNDLVDKIGALLLTIMFIIINLIITIITLKELNYI